jgi:hypothetical protein
VSKKRFTGGFDSIFGRAEEEPVKIMSDDIAPIAVEAAPLEPSAFNKKATTKNFTSDLDALFRDAMSEAVEERVTRIKRSVGIEDDPFEESTRQFKKPLSGLDALIRQTMETSLAGMEHAAVKRITLLFESAKIDKLKNIAKMERAFMKDLVQSVINEFITDYEKRKGAI